MQITGAMITQKPISLKIDASILEDLDKEVALGWRKRNNLINQAIAMYLRVIDARRRIRCAGSVQDKLKQLEDLESFVVPEAQSIRVLEKYILSEAADESIYDQAATESCTTDCLQYRQGTCPFRYHVKMGCLRFKEAYNRLTHPVEDKEEVEP